MQIIKMKVTGGTNFMYLAGCETGDAVVIDPSGDVDKLLARAKFRLGTAMKLDSLIADSKETLACALMSAALFIGLLVNALFSFPLADSIAGLIIAVFLFKEGLELVSEGRECG